jgi:hypothetical protein
MRPPARREHRRASIDGVRLVAVFRQPLLHRHRLGIDDRLSRLGLDLLLDSGQPGAQAGRNLFRDAKAAVATLKPANPNAAKREIASVGAAHLPSADQKMQPKKPQSSMDVIINGLIETVTPVPTLRFENTAMRLGSVTTTV